MGIVLYNVAMSISERHETVEVSPYINSREKRALDVTVATVAGPLAVAAVGASVAAVSAINRCSPIYRQERVTQGGGTFTMNKIRTFDTEGELLVGGVLLRRTGVDEIPQFLHVLEGDMSVVGPRALRPDLLNEVYRQLSAHQDSATVNPEIWMEMRDQVRPGITGPTQVLDITRNGCLDSRMAIVSAEQRYMQTASMREDLRILGRTPVVALMRENHTGEPES